MDVGMMMVFASYGWEDCSDDRVWKEEIRLARLAADSGFDCLWSAEHHFNDYSFVPDNLQLMTYLTALCPNVDLGTAADGSLEISIDGVNYLQISDIPNEKLQVLFKEAIEAWGKV